ncbi:hypothetical protein [Paraglaciecola marina]|uniref:hypothetical protein n=1 Tax=Paraglaciecola marina TaxID=2500157 RepID=UPI00105D740C|nr:hypothetical protein [Paraglaciecola marina]
MDAKPVAYETDSELAIDIASKLGEFDIISLQRLLKYHGYDEQQIWFSSHNSIASQNRIIEAVTFENDQAFVQLNIGLLASTGILPGYIRQFMDRPDTDEISLQHFFKLFDHILILNYLGQLYPEINRCFFDDWQHTKHCYTELQNMRSECSLHWLLSTAFPEFSVTTTPYTKATHSHQAELTLGSMLLGAIDKSTSTSFEPGFKIYLHLRPEWTPPSTDWGNKVKTRLNEWVSPWLTSFTLYLEIYLCISRTNLHLRLFGQSALGYDPFLSSQGQGTSTLGLNNEEPTHCTLVHHELKLATISEVQPTNIWNEYWRLSV